MDISLITTAAMTFLGPYVTKAAEKIAENVGEDLWTNVKGLFIKDEEKALVKKVEDNTVSKADLVAIENVIAEHLNNNNGLQQLIKSTLNITPSNEFMLENYLLVAEKIRKELKPLYLEQVDAGVAVTGDYAVRIAQLERKLSQTDEKIRAIITKQ